MCILHITINVSTNIILFLDGGSGSCVDNLTLHIHKSDLFTSTNKDIILVQ